MRRVAFGADRSGQVRRVNYRRLMCASLIARRPLRLLSERRTAAI